MLVTGSARSPHDTQVNPSCAAFTYLCMLPEGPFLALTTTRAHDRPLANKATEQSLSHQITTRQCVRARKRHMSCTMIRTRDRRRSRAPLPYVKLPILVVTAAEVAQTPPGTFRRAIPYARCTYRMVEHGVLPAILTLPFRDGWCRVRAAGSNWSGATLLRLVNLEASSQL